MTTGSTSSKRTRRSTSCRPLNSRRRWRYWTRKANASVIVRSAAPSACAKPGEFANMRMASRCYLLAISLWGTFLRRVDDALDQSVGGGHQHEVFAVADPVVTLRRHRQLVGLPIVDDFVGAIGFGQVL